MRWRAIYVRLRTQGLREFVMALKYGLTPFRWNIYRLTPTGETFPVERVSSDKAELATLREHIMEPDFFLDATGRAETCFFATCNQQLAGILWVLDCEHPSRFIALSNCDAELGSARVLGDFSSRGIMRSLIGHAMLHLHELGFQQAFATIRVDNVASTRAFGAATELVKVAEIRRPTLFGPRYIPAENRLETWLEAFRRFIWPGRTQSKSAEQPRKSLRRHLKSSS